MEWGNSLKKYSKQDLEIHLAMLEKIIKKEYSLKNTM